MEWIERVIRINSVTDKSNEELVRFLVPIAKESGLQVEEQKVTENGVTFKNLIAFNQSPTSPDLLVFNSHLDTVAAGDPADWTKTDGNPFRLNRVRDRIYGLGTADVKIDILCKFWAARLARPWNRPFAIVGTYGEERGLVGVTKLLEEKRIKPRFALVGEPSNLELIYAHKGHTVCTISIPWKKSPQATVKKVWKGKSAHSSTPDLGENAIRKATLDILKRGLGIQSLTGGTGSNKIPELCEGELLPGKTADTVRFYKVLSAIDELGQELKKRRDARFTPCYSTLSVNQVMTTDKDIQITFDIRLLPDVHTERLRSRIYDLEKSLGVTILSLAIDEPLRGQKNGRFITFASQALKETGIKVVKKTKASSTEAALYQKHGAEAIVFGPGLSVGNVHRPNEFNSIRQITQATKFYAHLLRTSFAGGSA